MAARKYFGWLSCSIVALGVFCFSDGAEAAEEVKAKPTKPNYEIIPIDSLRKGAGPRKPSNGNLDVVEQKGLGTPKFPDSDSEKKKLEEAKNLKEICADLEGKIVSFVEYVSLVENCKQRRIEDLQLLNQLLVDRKMVIVDITAAVFRAIPPGSPFLRKDFLELKKISDPSKEKVCAAYEGRSVTSDGEEFFLISGCKKNRFASFQNMLNNNRSGRPVVVLSPDELGLFPLGKDMPPNEKDDDSFLYRMDGDVVWSRLYEGKVERDSEDSLDKFKRIDSEKGSQVDRKELCTSLQGRVVSFFSKMYFVDKCVRRSLDGIPLSLQARIADEKGIADMTSGQYRLLPEGETIGPDELNKKMGF